MIKVNKNGVELSGEMNDVMRDITMVMLAIRDYAYPFYGEDAMDKLLHNAVEASKHFSEVKED